MREGRVLRLIQNTDMRCGQDGLLDLCSAFKVSAKELKPGELVVFVNSTHTMLKILASTGHGWTVTAYRSPRGRLEMRAVKHIPSCFTPGRQLHFDSAVAKVLAELLPEKGVRRAKAEK